MSDLGVLEKYKRQWHEMDMKFKVAIFAVLIGGSILFVQRRNERLALEQQQEAQKIAEAITKSNRTDPNLPNSSDNFSALPTTNRNLGLEDMKTLLDKMRTDVQGIRDQTKAQSESVNKMVGRVSELEKNGSTKLPMASGARDTPGVAAGAESTGAPYEQLPPPVNFGQPGSGDKSVGGNPFAANEKAEETGGAAISATRMHVWDSESKPETPDRNAGETPILVPINSALESVMLTGINARTNATGGLANGTILSANNVGSPFVTRLKGNAILPNGWKVSDFSDCFISGTGIAIMSSERANVISNVMSCIDKQGNVLEAPIKAYGVDLDGIQGISGRVVSKQGALLAKSAWAGIFDGLGSSFAPTALPSYNRNAQSGDRQGIQLPNPSLIAGTALGSGISESGRALHKFYLDYAKEMFPVIEVNAGTRITWILQESVELNLKKR